jgi:hypothetical protein
MIYLTDRNHGIGLHVIDFHCIRCEYEFHFGDIIFHLIHREKINENFGYMQHILKAFDGEFNPSFSADLN